MSSASPYALRSSIFIPTTKEVPADAAIPSHQLLLRAGFMRKSSNGIYMMLPLALRSLAKLEAIIDNHMHAIGCSKLSMPNLLHNELWKETGRWESSGPELFRVHDRRDVAHCLGPTHEEVFTSLVASTVTSPKALPLRLYQIGRKFRDEIRPRFGLLRAKEFIMKDAYTFDVDREGAEVTYNLMVQAYHAILNELDVPIAQVEADTGNIGGSLSHEFHVLSGFGEDAILSCGTCDYAANVEKARGVVRDSPTQPATFADVVDQIADSVVISYYHEALGSSTRVVAILTPAGREVNVLALKAHSVEVDNLTPCSAASIDSSLPVQYFIDSAVAVHGAPATAIVGEFRQAKEHDGCPNCAEGVLAAKRGIEVGCVHHGRSSRLLTWCRHVFYLGDKYSKTLGANFIDSSNHSQPMVMGCYGMGVTRLLAAAVESLHDSHGIVWPQAIVPYRVVVVGFAKKADDDVAVAARAMASTLASVWPDDVVLDDRWGERPGLKLTEAELIGYTWRVVLGKRFATEGLVEVLYRPTMQVDHVPVDRVQALIQQKH
ncbi:hypothetical protein DYB32_000908 [Aphanomyces invadans]|uniref:proline--tRNA ligase n=1 Tax=Aphanomyces invadans TaxID=157072 RepID=A0A418B8J6_9STRA|nr:hypothetical protein DYB32_000908 [Aphanomyces invadans]